MSRTGEDGFSVTLTYLALNVPFKDMNLNIKMVEEENTLPTQRFIYMLYYSIED